MRTVIAGAGALGSLIGGLLARAGEDVVLLAHGPHAEALRRSPLELVLPDETAHVEVATAERAGGDVVVLTAKRFDSDAALATVTGTPRLTLSLQNGPGKNDELVKRFGAETVVGAATTTAARLLEPGVVTSPSLGITYIGSRPEAAGFVEALRRAGLDARATEDAESVEWSKLAHVASSMIVQALVPLPLHELFGKRETAALLRTVIDEIGQVAIATGAGLLDLEGLLPVATLAEADEVAAETILGTRAAALETAGATNLRTSLTASIEAGKRTEIRAIHGGLIERAAALGVDVPALVTCYRLAVGRGVRA